MSTYGTNLDVIPGAQVMVAAGATSNVADTAQANGDLGALGVDNLAVPSVTSRQ